MRAEEYYLEATAIVNSSTYLNTIEKNLLLKIISDLPNQKGYVALFEESEIDMFTLNKLVKMKWIKCNRSKGGRVCIRLSFLNKKSKTIPRNLSSIPDQDLSFSDYIESALGNKR